MTCMVFSLLIRCHVVFFLVNYVLVDAVFFLFFFSLQCGLVVLLIMSSVGFLWICCIT